MLGLGPVDRPARRAASCASCGTRQCDGLAGHMGRRSRYTAYRIDGRKSLTRSPGRSGPLPRWIGVGFPVDRGRSTDGSGPIHRWIGAGRPMDRGRSPGRVTPSSAANRMMLSTRVNMYRNRADLKFASGTFVPCKHTHDDFGTFSDVDAR